MKLNSLIFIIIFSILLLEKGYTQEKNIFLGFEGGAGPKHWKSAGPIHWKDLADMLTLDLYLCREGTHQSPININNTLGHSPSKFLTNFSPTPIRIINNSHTIHLSYDSGSYINWGNKRFELIQFHFHSPSEHLIKGKKYAMEMHLVYKTHDNKFLVIGVLMEKGKSNALIQKIWDKIPIDKNKEVYYEDILFNVGNLLPSKKNYFHYSGSLTTAPCLENVSWFISETPIEVSIDQILFFQKFIKHNARPIQQLNNRSVLNVE